MESLPSAWVLVGAADPNQTNSDAATSYGGNEPAAQCVPRAGGLHAPGPHSWQGSGLPGQDALRQRGQALRPLARTWPVAPPFSWASGPPVPTPTVEGNCLGLFAPITEASPQPDADNQLSLTPARPLGLGAERRLPRRTLQEQ